MSDRTPHWWYSRVAFSGVLLLAAIGLAVYEHVTPDLLRMGLLIGTAVCVCGLVLDLTTVAAPDWEVVSARSVNPQGQDQGLNRNVRMLENHLTSRTVEPVLQLRLLRLTEARLTELGLRRGDPGVDEKLGPTLCEVLDSPPRQLSTSTLEECIRRIEELSA